MLEVKNLHKNFGTKEVLKGISFTVNAGKIVGLIGKNGSGKTTTFHSILKFIDFTGDILLDGHHINENDYEIIGYLPEERSLMPKMTIFEQVCYLANLKGISTKTVKEQLPQWLDKLQVVGKMNDKIKSLSKGNKQKVQLIATLMHQPKFIILDEPFSGLDPINTGILKNVIFEEQKRGAIIIFSDHSMNNVEELCDEVVMIREGEVILNGSIQEVRESFGLTRIFVRCDKSKEQLLQLPGVIDVILKKDGRYCLKLENQDFGQEIFRNLTQDGYIQTFDQEPPTLDEIFKLKAGDVHE